MTNNGTSSISTLSEDNEYVLHEPFVNEEPPNTAPQAVKDAYLKHKKDNRDVRCLMLGTMIPDLIKQFDGLGVWLMMDQLKLMFEEQARLERFKIMCSLLNCKLANGCSVCPHVLKMKSHFDDLELFGAKMHKELAVDMILHSLPNSFRYFVLNYDMNEFQKATREKRKSKESTKKAKVVVLPKSKPDKGECHYCHEIRHYHRKNNLYLEDLKKNKLVEASCSGSTKK
ncbi:PREDICTED: uncharacterized protein LOC104807984 [Tarenaya hassleriana]|uniref:uncharacterized protein LOC104807984 n=1 Tax=Tarenaya hassleriana TaxID=28532 RepID=UPI00053C9CED|nr:PREDICTED: uncharacterized protein LOC104807984 [Tarenaya hassleriana]